MSICVHHARTCKQQRGVRVILVFPLMPFHLCVYILWRLFLARHCYFLCCSYDIMMCVCQTNRILLVFQSICSRSARRSTQWFDICRIPEAQRNIRHVTDAFWSTFSASECFLFVFYATIRPKFKQKIWLNIWCVCRWIEKPFTLERWPTGIASERCGKEKIKKKAF